MAQIDASGLAFTYDGTNTASVRYFAFGAATADDYTWVTGNAAPFYRITASSHDGGLTPFPPAGTVEAITITNDAYAAGLSILGLSVPLSSLFGEGNNAAADFEKFWETVLAGATTIVLPSGNNPFSILGDFATVETGKTLSGSVDRFVGSKQPGAGTLIGDAFQVAAGATLTGGADVWDDVGTGVIVGDVGGDAGGTVLGRLNGGADRVTLIDGFAVPTFGINFLIGDAWTIGAGGVAFGGADVFTLRNIAGVGNVAGDNLRNEGGSSTGGDDAILIETAVAGRAKAGAGVVVGDDFQLTGPGVTGIGGADTITLTNVNADYVLGDFYDASNVTVTGGDDRLTLRATFGTPATVTYVSGDMKTPSEDSSFVGGDDAITMVNVLALLVAGDALGSIASREITGGDDAISILFNLPGFGDSFYRVYGDTASSSSSGDFTGGDDTIAVNLQGSSPGEAILLYGDAFSATFGDDALFTNGDDVVRLTSGAYQRSTIYGDLAEAFGQDGLGLVDGNDSLTGGGGADLIYGDTALAGSGPGGTFVRDFGDDTLDGRGGNDTLDGGGGTDTAVFSLNQAVTVNLNGIRGSAAGDLYEATGQGNDQLIGIDNVTGSAQGDVIVGTRAANVLKGQGGADSLNGGAGGDTASYEDSNAGVVVNLQTGVTSGGHAQGDKLVSIERLVGSRFADTLVGANGVSDTLDGGLGADSMRGAEAYVVDNAGDVVDEAFSGSGGIDVVFARVSVNLTNAARFKGAIEDVTLGDGAGLNVVGNALANTITGNATGNLIAGGLGNDTLAGGGGTDRFLFDTAPNAASNRDTILDFAVDDRIDLENAVFSQLTTTGVLASNLFKNTAAGAIDSDDRVIYDAATGVMTYDINGSGAGGATQFAVLGTGLALTTADVFVV